MIYREVERRLDMRMGFSIEFRHKLILMIQKEIGTIPATMHHMDHSSHIDLFIRAPEDARIAGIISSFDLVRRGEYYIVQTPDYEFPELQAISRKLLSLSSSVPGEFYMMGDRLYNSIRFHHSDLQQVSKIAGEIINSAGGARLEDLGPSLGGIRTLDNINARIPLTLISFKFSRGDGIPKELLLDHYGEANIEMMSSGKYKVNIYPAEPVKWQGYPDVISAEEGIYTYMGVGEFQRDLFTKAGERRMPMASVISKVTGGEIFLNQFLPAAFKDEHLEILLDTARRHPSANFRLTAIRKYDSSIWDWL